jgi:hypothetical protein
MLQRTLQRTLQRMRAEPIGGQVTRRAMQAMAGSGRTRLVQ